MNDDKIHEVVNENITPKTWTDFRETGLCLFINQFLHIFGWVLCFDIENGNIKNVFPARTKFRGFDNSVTDEQIFKSYSIHER